MSPSVASARFSSFGRFRSYLQRECGSSHCWLEEHDVFVYLRRVLVEELEKNRCPNSRRTWSVYSDIGPSPSLFVCYRQQLPQVYSGAITEETLLHVLVCFFVNSTDNIYPTFTRKNSSLRNIFFPGIPCTFKWELEFLSISKDLKERL